MLHEGGGGGRGQASFRDAVIDHFWCPWIVMYRKTHCSVNRDWSALCETLTAKILNYLRKNIEDQSKIINL